MNSQNWFECEEIQVSRNSILEKAKTLEMQNPEFVRGALRKEIKSWEVA